MSVHLIHVIQFVLSCHACVNFSRLCSGSPTLLHSDSQASSTGLHMLHNIDLRKIFEYAHLKFISPSKQTYTHTWYSHTSVGLAQARPATCLTQARLTILLRIHNLLSSGNLSNLHSWFSSKTTTFTLETFSFGSKVHVYRPESDHSSLNHCQLAHFQYRNM